MSGQLHVPVAFTEGKEPHCPLNRRLCWVPAPLWAFQKRQKWQHIRRCLHTEGTSLFGRRLSM